MADEGDLKQASQETVQQIGWPERAAEWLKGLWGKPHQTAAAYDQAAQRAASQLIEQPISPADLAGKAGADEQEPEPAEEPPPDQSTPALAPQRAADPELTGKLDQSLSILTELLQRVERTSSTLTTEQQQIILRVKREATEITTRRQNNQSEQRDRQLITRALSELQNIAPTSALTSTTRQRIGRALRQLGIAPTGTPPASVPPASGLPTGAPLTSGAATSKPTFLQRLTAPLGRAAQWLDNLGQRQPEPAASEQQASDGNAAQSGPGSPPTAATQESTSPPGLTPAASGEAAESHRAIAEPPPVAWDSIQSPPEPSGDPAQASDKTPSSPPATPPGTDKPSFLQRLTAPLGRAAQWLDNLGQRQQPAAIASQQASPTATPQQAAPANPPSQSTTPALTSPAAAPPTIGPPAALARAAQAVQQTLDDPTGHAPASIEPMREAAPSGDRSSVPSEPVALPTDQNPAAQNLAAAGILNAAPAQTLDQGQDAPTSTPTGDNAQISQDAPNTGPASVATTGSATSARPPAAATARSTREPPEPTTLPGNLPALAPPATTPAQAAPVSPEQPITATVDQRAAQTSTSPYETLGIPENASQLDIDDALQRVESQAQQLSPEAPEQEVRATQQRVEAARTAHQAIATPEARASWVAESQQTPALIAQDGVKGTPVEPAPAIARVTIRPAGGEIPTSQLDATAAKSLGSLADLPPDAPTSQPAAESEDKPSSRTQGLTTAQVLQQAREKALVPETAPARQAEQSPAGSAPPAGEPSGRVAAPAPAPPSGAILDAGPLALQANEPITSPAAIEPARVAFAPDDPIAAPLPGLAPQPPVVQLGHQTPQATGPSGATATRSTDIPPPPSAPLDLAADQAAQQLAPMAAVGGAAPPGIGGRGPRGGAAGAGGRNVVHVWVDGGRLDGIGQGGAAKGAAVVSGPTTRTGKQPAGAKQRTGKKGSNLSLPGLALKAGTYDYARHIGTTLMQGGTEAAKPFIGEGPQAVAQSGTQSLANVATGAMELASGNPLLMAKGAADVGVELAKLPSLLVDWSEALISSKESIKDFNQEIAAAFASAELRTVQRGFESGQRTGGATSNLMGAYQDLQDTLQPMKDSAFNAIARDIANGLRVLNDLASLVREGLSALNLVESEEDRDKRLMNEATPFQEMVKSIEAGGFTAENRETDKMEDVDLQGGGYQAGLGGLPGTSPGRGGVALQNLTGREGETAGTRPGRGPEKDSDEAPAVKTMFAPTAEARDELLERHKDENPVATPMPYSKVTHGPKDAPAYKTFFDQEAAFKEKDRLNAADPQADATVSSETGYQIAWTKQSEEQQAANRRARLQEEKSRQLDIAGADRDLTDAAHKASAKGVTDATRNNRPRDPNWTRRMRHGMERSIQQQDDNLHHLNAERDQMEAESQLDTAQQGLQTNDVGAPGSPFPGIPNVGEPQRRQFPTVHQSATGKNDGQFSVTGAAVAGIFGGPAGYGTYRGKQIQEAAQAISDHPATKSFVDAISHPKIPPSILGGSKDISSAGQLGSQVSQLLDAARGLRNAFATMPTDTPAPPQQTPVRRLP